MAVDLATQWLLESGNNLRTFDNWCLELANEVGQWLWRQGIRHTVVYVEPTVVGEPVVAHYPSGVRRWKYHAVLAANGRIHDAWRREALRPAAYFADVFRGQRVRAEYQGGDPRKDFDRREIWSNGRRFSVEHG
jgi:hypothetical protein